MAVDHELALEEALQRIGGDTNESDEDNMSVVSGYEGQEEEEQAPSYTTSHRLFPRTSQAPSSVSLKQILDDERSFTLFRRFLKDQCISRNLQFWLSCEYYRNQPLSDKTQVLEMAKAIYVKFLKSSAPLHVSVLDGTRHNIQVVMQKCQLRDEPDLALFQQAQQEIYQQMEANELRQFLCSDAFSECPQFNRTNALGSVISEMGFQPSRYRNGGSLHSSDDSTSVTSFTSEEVCSTHTQVLCMPPHTRLAFTPRNAHSDTEHSSRTQHTTGMTTHYSRNKILTQNQFYDILYERLVAVQKDRANLKQRARNIAREAGKLYEEIMSMEWFDAPEAIKYARFDEETPPTKKESSSYIISIAAREIQEAVKDLDITRQVRQKRTSNISSSASSYISDSGVGESFFPSSGSGPQHISSRGAPQRVQAYLQSQQHFNSQLSERDAKAHLAATMLMNNSVHSEELNPTMQGRRHFNNYPGAYSSDDSSSCFTATSHSSNSEFFIPRRTHHVYGDSNEGSTRHSRYPPGMRRMTSNPRRPPPSRFIPPPPPPQQPSLRAMSPAVPSSTDSLLVAYTMDGFNSTLAKRVQSNQLTLGEFKEKVFARRGHYRFFFKSFCEELGSEVLEEISEDGQQLPLYEGKIVGHVEKINDL